jgi:hypothetical protein
MLGPNVRRVFYVLAFLPICAVLFAFACSGTTTSDVIPPITGIVVRAETLTLGRGCGRAPGQVFKYAAVAYGYNGSDFPAPAQAEKLAHDNPEKFSPVTAAIYDCFTDGTFVQLPPQPTPNGILTYRLELYVFDATAYDRTSNEIVAVVNGIANKNEEGDPKKLALTFPTWTTTCVGTQQQDVQVLANCDPIVFGNGGIATGGDAGVKPAPAAIELATQQFALADGGAIACDEDGGVPEAGPTDAGDAEAAAPIAPSTTFTTVRVVPSTPGAVGPSVDVTCPATYHFEPPQQAAAFSLDVTLLGGNGARVGHTTCAASAEPGRTSSAACQPVAAP